MNRLAFDPYSPVFQRVIDGLISAAALWFSYQFFFEGQVPPAAATQMWALLLVMPVGRVCINETLRCYRTIWRYVGLWDAMVLACSYGAFSLMLFMLRFVTLALRIPMAVLVTELSLSFAAAVAARVARRMLYERGRKLSTAAKTDAVLLIGAGRAGVNVANQLRAAGALRPAAFLDDDPKKMGLIVAGLRVLGPISRLGSVAARYGIQQVIVCIASPPRQMLRRVWAESELLGIQVKIVPTIEEILRRKINAINFRDVEMNDLLGRKPVEQPSTDPAVTATYAGRRILITGAGGSIGSELAVQISKFDPSSLLLLDKDENGLHDTYSRLESAVRSRTTAVIADLRFADRLRGVLETFRPEIIFHAAAHKHVHLMEVNPCEAITNNVTGTRNLVEQSLALGVSRFVQVSTDKAVNPTSIMGASKRVCEMIVQAQARNDRALFCCVRFGNVLGSRGSVVPVFQEQIQRGGPVTLTHRDAQRFLMTIPEAVSLLIQAGTLANSRDIFVLDMGPSVMIQKLAEDLIELSGLSPNRDVRIEITGLKPGEKISEVLADSGAELYATAVEKVKAIRPRTFDMVAFANGIRALERSAWEGNTEQVYRHLANLNIGYQLKVQERAWPMPHNRAVPSSAVAPTLAPELS